MEVPTRDGRLTCSVGDATKIARVNRGRMNLSQPQMFVYCRAGFESDCAAELCAAAERAGTQGQCVYDAGQAYVLWFAVAGHKPARHSWTPQLIDLVFARQKFGSLRLVDCLRSHDRISPLLAAAGSFAARFSALWFEAPDSESGRQVLRRTRKLEDSFRARLLTAGLLGASPVAPRLHVCVVAPERAYIGVSDTRDSAPWPMGIPRLRSPAGTPSRSGMKLVEALATFISEDAMLRRMRAGRVAVDLGAAPGGWSRVLASRGMRVIAVDNGPIATAVLATELVEHRREDAFRFRPQGAVDWMVCDVVAAPARIAALAAQWIARAWCRETIFNLKLPNRNGWLEVSHCRAVIERTIARSGVRYELRLKHLYHDRDEVTAHLRRL